MKQLPSNLAQLPEGAWVENFPQAVASDQNSAPPNGGIYAGVCWLSRLWPLSSITFGSSGAAVSPVNQWAALWKHDTLALIAVTADDTTAGWPATTAKTFPFASTTFVPESGLYYVGLMAKYTSGLTIARGGLATARKKVEPYLVAQTAGGLYTTPATAPDPLPLVVPPTLSPPYVYVS